MSAKGTFTEKNRDEKADNEISSHIKKQGRFFRTVLLIIVLLVQFVMITNAQNIKLNKDILAEINYICDVSNGFNFVQQDHKIVGYVECLKIGDLVLNKDFNVTNPLNIDQSIQVFGVISSISWPGGYADPIQFAAQVSLANKQSIAELLLKGISQSDIEFNFCIYEYDDNATSYYKAFSNSNANLKGFIYKSGGEFVVSIDLDQSLEVTSPKNYSFNLGVMPGEELQSITRRFSVKDSLLLSWGYPNDGNSTAVSGEVNVPLEFDIKQNYPNPFNPATTISYTLPEAGAVQIKIYDILGREVAKLVDEQKSAGKHSVVWNGNYDSGKMAASGNYFYRIICGDFVQTKKMILLK